MSNLFYESPDIKIIYFSEDKVITASVVEVTRDQNKPIELPFVPFH